MTAPNFTLTGTVASLVGAADQGYALVTLVGFGNAAPKAIGGPMVPHVTQKAQCNSSGTFAILLFGNDQIANPGTSYTVTLISATGSNSQTRRYTLTGGGTHDISALTAL